MGVTINPTFYRTCARSDGRRCCHAHSPVGTTRARQTNALRLQGCQCDNMRTLWLVTYLSVRAIQPAPPTIGHRLAKPQQTDPPYFTCVNLWFWTDVYGQYTDISNRRRLRFSPPPAVKDLLYCSSSLVLVGSTLCLSLQMGNTQQTSSLHAHISELNWTEIILSYRKGSYKR